MLTPTDIYLQRLIALRDFGFPQAEKMEREGRLDFSSFRTCLLCAWVETEYAQADGFRKTSLGYPFKLGEEFKDALAGEGLCAGYFGLDDWRCLFGQEGSLSDRRARLDAIIAERMVAA